MRGAEPHRPAGALRDTVQHAAYPDFLHDFGYQVKRPIDTPPESTSTSRIQMYAQALTQHRLIIRQMIVRDALKSALSQGRGDRVGIGSSNLMGAIGSPGSTNSLPVEMTTMAG